MVRSGSLLTSLATAVFCFAGVVTAGDVDSNGPLVVNARNSASSLLQKQQDNDYQDYFANGRTGDESTDQAGPSKRSLSWGDRDRDAAGFWKRYSPSKESMFWKRRSGLFGDPGQSSFWKRGQLHDLRKLTGSGAGGINAFWKRSEQLPGIRDLNDPDVEWQPDNEQQDNPEKRILFPLPMMLYPRYRNVLPAIKMTSPLTSDVSLDWLKRALSRKGKTQHGQINELPLPPKDRRQEPKLNPDFNPTGW